MSTPATKSSKTKAPGTSRKPSRSAAKPAASSPAKPAARKGAKPTVVNAPQPVILGPTLRKKELIESIVERSGLKKREVRPVVEAMLDTLAEALADNRELNLPPFGRLKVRKERDLPNARVVTAKLRQSKRRPAPKTAATETDPSEE